jgi:hypothetical protein
MAKNRSEQKLCGFYVKHSFENFCSHLKFDEYCSCFQACDFADGKDINFNDIPNIGSIKKNNTQFSPDGPEYRDTLFDRNYEYIETENGPRRVLRKKRRVAPRRYSSDPGSYLQSNNLITEEEADRWNNAISFGDISDLKIEADKEILMEAVEQHQMFHRIAKSIAFAKKRGMKISDDMAMRWGKEGPIGPKDDE